MKTANQTVLHLTTLASTPRTLCGLPLAEVQTGVYVEQLEGTDEREFRQFVYGPDGREGQGCAVCLQRQPTMLIKQPTVADFTNAQIVLTIIPMPQKMKDDYQVKGECTNPDYYIPEPAVTTQYRDHGTGKMILGLTVRVVLLQKPIARRVRS